MLEPAHATGCTLLILSQQKQSILSHSDTTFKQVVADLQVVQVARKSLPSFKTACTGGCFRGRRAGHPTPVETGILTPYNTGLRWLGAC